MPFDRWFYPKHISYIYLNITGIKSSTLTVLVPCRPNEIDRSLTAKLAATFHHPRLIEALVPVWSQWVRQARCWVLPAGRWEHMAGHMADFGNPAFVDPTARPSCSDKTRRGGAFSSISDSPKTVRESWDKARRLKALGHTHSHAQRHTHIYCNTQLQKITKNTHMFTLLYLWGLTLT